MGNKRTKPNLIADSNIPIILKDYFEFEEIGNQYGGLCVKAEDSKYYWGIGDWDGTDWVEIPKSLCAELIKFKENNEKVNYENINTEQNVRTRTNILNK